MEIIIGGLAFFVTQLVKKIAAKMGVEYARNTVLLIVFLFVFAVAFIVRANFVSMDTLNFIAKTFGLAVAWYEVIWKGFLKNILQPNPADQV